METSLKAWWGGSVVVAVGGDMRQVTGKTQHLIFDA